MKYLFTFVYFIICYGALSQSNATPALRHKKLFIRLYNARFEKIGKGYLLTATDSTVTVLNEKKQISWPVKDIAVIITRRSAGHNILISYAACIGAGIILGAVKAPAYTAPYKTESSIEAGLLFPATGILIGGATALARKKEIFQINGNTQKWMAVKEKLLNINN